ncbi:MAG: hypothetical protein HUU15_12890 [Candidatus Brocadiae bacterium]|nr:hypothetical protein [Candidatus Brocadiia bacterium]
MRTIFGRRRGSPVLTVGLLVGVGALGLGGAAWKYPGAVRSLLQRARGVEPRTVEQVLDSCGQKAELRFAPACRAAGIDWPPARVRLLAFKRERRLEVWVAGPEGPFVPAAAYPVLGASGGPGPKRRDGDGQVPEGMYGLSELNPNSGFHLAVRVNYPNQEDFSHAVVAPAQMGSDVMVHGGDVSTGCLAIGDPAIEDVFCLLAHVPVSGRDIWIAPVDFRREPGWMPGKEDPWVLAMYRRLAERLGREHAVKDATARR